MNKHRTEVGMPRMKFKTVTPVCRARKLSWYSGFRNKSRHAGHARLEISMPGMPGMKTKLVLRLSQQNQHAGHARHKTGENRHAGSEGW